VDITQKHLIMQAFCSINFHIQKSAGTFFYVFLLKNKQKTNKKTAKWAVLPSIDL